MSPSDEKSLLDRKVTQGTFADHIAGAGSR